MPRSWPSAKLILLCRRGILSPASMEWAVDPCAAPASFPPANAYDSLSSLVTELKSIRYHWQGILSVIRSLPGGLGERSRARAASSRIGATVNLLDDRGTPRWSLDPLLVITPDEWAMIESGSSSAPACSTDPGRPLRPAWTCCSQACCRRPLVPPTGISCAPAGSNRRPAAGPSPVALRRRPGAA